MFKVATVPSTSLLVDLTGGQEESDTCKSLTVTVLESAFKVSSKGVFVVI